MQELLLFTPLYTVVGVYRLLSDRIIREKVWDKLRHGFRRGAIVGAVWAVSTFTFQRAFVSFFLLKSPRITGLAHDNVFGYKIDVATYATCLFLSSQIQGILNFFVGKNLRIARDRAWEQTLASRGKEPEFWGPYVEEWQNPPQVGVSAQAKWEKWVTSGIGRLLIRKVILLPLDFYPGVGLVISSAIKAIGTARFLHKPYFDSKKMTPHQIAVFMAEHRLDYHAFGFAAALLESIPLTGLFFTISNRIGACMWAFDLEKRQHMFKSGELKPIAPRIMHVPGAGPNGETERVALNPRTEDGILASPGIIENEKMAGAWSGDVRK